VLLRDKKRRKKEVDGGGNGIWEVRVMGRGEGEKRGEKEGRGPWKVVLSRSSIYSFILFFYGAGRII